MERWHGVSRDGEGKAVLSVYYLSLFIQAVTVSFQLTVLIQAHPHPKQGRGARFERREAHKEFYYAEERIQKIMAEQGLCSRRAAEQIIAEGR